MKVDKFRLEDVFPSQDGSLKLILIDCEGDKHILHFKEAISVDLEEINDASGARYEINVYTLDDNHKVCNLIYEFETQSFETALSTFERKVIMIIGLLE